MAGSRRARQRAPRSAAWTAALLGALAAGTPAVARAQGTVDLACHPARVDAMIPTESHWRPRHPVVLAESLLVLEQDGRWEAAMQRIQALFREDARFFPDTSPLAPVYAHVRDSLDAFAARLAAALTAEGSEGVDGATMFTVQERPVEGGYTILAQREVIPADAPLAQARSLCFLGHAMTRFHERLTLVARQQSEIALRRRVERWSAFMDDGLTPYPWELALNEAINWFGLRQPLEPPRLQLIALRPSAAIETDHRLEQRTNVLVVEAVGLVLYPGSRRWWLSLAGTWSSPSEATAGLGVLVRVAPWLVSAGVSWRDVDGDGERERRVLLSLDAYDLLRSAPQRLREAAARATGGRLTP